jgi:large subunit ribosomal protein L40e
MVAFNGMATTIETLQAAEKRRRYGPQFYVKVPGGKSIIFDYAPSLSVSMLKYLVQEKEGILVAHQRLIFGGKNLEEGRAISDYNIQKETTVECVLRLRGGAPGVGEFKTCFFIYQKNKNKH